MKMFFLISFLFLSSFGFRQDTTFYDSKWRETTKFNDVAYYKVTSYDKDDPDKVHVVIYYNLTNTPKYEKNYSSYKKGMLEGKVKWWHPNGQLAAEANYLKGNLDGEIISHNENGEITRQDVYKNGDLVGEGKSFSSSGVRLPHTSFYIIPEFPGGIDKLFQFLATELKYPKRQRNKRIQGTVKVSFFILEDGSVANIHVVESPNEDFSDEAIRVVKRMPKWKPGIVDQKIEPYEMVLPISFKLQEY